MVVISVPGLTNWAKNEEETINKKALDGYKSVPTSSDLEPENTSISAKRSSEDPSAEEPSKKKATEEKYVSMKELTKELPLPLDNDMSMCVENDSSQSSVIENPSSEKNDTNMLTEEPMENDETIQVKDLPSINNNVPDIEFSVEHYLNHPMPDIKNHTCILKVRHF